MSLKFLAVGQTLAGIRGDKSPYAVRKDNRLPIFEGTPRFTPKAAPEPTAIQTDWLEPGKSSVPAALRNEAGQESPFKNPSPAAVSKPKRKWFSFFGMKWFRTSKPRADLVQGELSIEKVRVLRNDLADADLELVLKKKKKKAKALFVAREENNHLPRQGWSELAAKLFDIGQK